MLKNRVADAVFSRRTLLTACASNTVLSIVFKGTTSQATPADSLDLQALSRRNLDAVSRLRASERIIVDYVLLNDLPAYLAFASSAAAYGKGNAAVLMFDTKLAAFSQRTLARRASNLRALADILAQRLTLDFLLTFNKNDPATSLRKVLSPAIPTLGPPGIALRQIEPSLSASAFGSVSATPELLFSNTLSINLHPVVPTLISNEFNSSNLALIEGDQDTGSVLAASVAVLATNAERKAISDVTAISDAFEKVGITMANLGAGLTPLTQPEAGGPPDVGQLTITLAESVTKLGNALRMNKTTIQKIDTGIRVAGSALSGAMAGMAIGPVGAVAGGVVGLLGGLFGGSGSDPTLQAVSKINDKLNDLQNALQTGLIGISTEIASISGEVSQLSNQITLQMATLSSQVANGFNNLQSQISSLQNQISDFQARMEENFEQVKDAIRDQAKQQLADTFNAFADSCANYEAAYRVSVVSEGNAATSNADLLGKLQTLIDTIVHPLDDFSKSTGFSQVSFVGNRGYSAHLDAISSELGGLPLRGVLQYGGAFGISPNLFSSGIGGSLVPLPAALTRLSDERASLSKRLLDGRFLDGTDIGVALLHDLESQCCRALDGFSDSPEAAFMRSDERFLLPSSDIALPAVAPLDLASFASITAGTISNLSDVKTAKVLLDICTDALKPHLAFHSLLTSQQLLPALLYARRNIASSLATSCATLFCNPFMAGVDVIRRAISTRLAQIMPGITVLPYHSKIILGSLESAQSYLRRQTRDSMPLAGATDLKFESDIPEMQGIDDILSKYFASFSAPPSGLYPADSQVAGAALYDLAPKLLPVIQRITGTSLSVLLANIRSQCLTLGVIEARIKVWQAGLRAANITVVNADMHWFEGLQEYGTLATYALGGELVNDPPLDPEIKRANAVVASFLSLTIIPIMSPSLALPDNPASHPYPLNIGALWGWGAEDLAPQRPTPNDVLVNLLRPECSFAGVNMSMLGATATFCGMVADSTQFAAGATVVERLKRQLPEGIRAELRRQLMSS